jgi:hypothetical protein
MQAIHHKHENKDWQPDHLDRKMGKFTTKSYQHVWKLTIALSV